MSVPSEWWPFLAFNKVVPEDCLPHELRGEEVYLASRVLPMGFLNSVSLAQHVHRNLALASEQPGGVLANPPESELRKDRTLPSVPASWRIYLDNYDLLERVDKVTSHNLEGSVAAGVLALRQQYEVWDIPRNVKKSVTRSLQAEVQGALVDGELGVAFPKPDKLGKYFAATLKLLSQPRVSQRQMQVVCGGLVYVSMFRRQLLGCLNVVWRFVESFKGTQNKFQALPGECRLELLRFLGLFPLAKLDFRLGMHQQVTCSDASTTGGGICCSTGLTPRGVMVSEGELRGERPERSDVQVLSVGLFDGIGALRVALDLLGLPCLAHISVDFNGRPGPQTYVRWVWIGALGVWCWNNDLVFKTATLLAHMGPRPWGGSSSHSWSWRGPKGHPGVRSAAWRGDLWGLAKGWRDKTFPYFHNIQAPSDSWKEASGSPTLHGLRNSQMARG